MGMHQPGWREKNEERATEAWRAEVLGRLAEIRASCHRVEAQLLTPYPAFRDDVGIIEDAAEALWQLRHGPEQPE